MKTVLILILALLETTVLSTSALFEKRIPAHLHLNQPVRASRASGVVSQLVRQTTERGNAEIEYHIHMDQIVADLDNIDDIEDFGIGDIFKGIVKGFDILKQGIDIAINKAAGAFNKVKNEISHIRLPPIKIPKLVLPVINIAKVASRMVPCAMKLKSILPNLFNFAKAASANNASQAVKELLAMLRYMPDISSKCINKPFKIPPKVMSKIQCGADITALAAIVGQFILAPENVIGNINGIRSMIDLIPTTISDCTGAFK